MSYTVQQVADQLGVNYATAQRYVKQVQAEGVAPVLGFCEKQ